MSGRRLSGGAKETSLRQSDPAQPIAVSRIISQRVESGLHPDIEQSIGTDDVGVLQLGERSLLSPTVAPYASHSKPADVPLPRLSLNRA